jgi:hypothetical protein
VKGVQVVVLTGFGLIDGRQAGESVGDTVKFAGLIVNQEAVLLQILRRADKTEVHSVRRGGGQGHREVNRRDVIGISDRRQVIQGGFDHISNLTYHPDDAGDFQLSRPIMLLSQCEKTTKKHNRLDGYRRRNGLEVSVVIIALNVEDHRSVTAFLRRIDVEVQTTSAILIHQPLRVLEDRLDSIEGSKLSFRRMRVASAR